MKDYELLERQVSVMKMAEKYGIDDWRKLVQYLEPDNEWTNIAKMCECLHPYYKHRFALGVVEGKPVFEGDILCNAVGMRYTVGKNSISPTDFIGYGIPTSEEAIAMFSWNPPKPKTVMVELTVKDAEEVAKFFASSVSTAYQNTAEACRKALEAQSE